MGLLGAWEDSAECSGDSNTVAMNGSVGFPKRSWPRSGLARIGLGKSQGVGHGISQVLSTSAGAVAEQGAQASLIVGMGCHERASGRDGSHASGQGHCCDQSRM